MTDLFGLFTALPVGYFLFATQVANGDLLSLIPATGMIALIAGLLLILYQKAWRSSWLLTSIVLSEILVIVAGLLRGRFDNPGPWLALFVAIQLALLATLVFRLKSIRLTTVPLAYFAFTFALAAAGLADMSFTDSWI